jgi:large subunit ribosomal protein L9
MMEVILRDDVPSLGKAGEMVRVRPGYARNYLLPKGLAYEASEGNKKRIAAEGKARATRQASERTEAQGMAQSLAGLSLTLSAKAGEGDRLFGSITSQDIADAVAAKGVTLDKRKIALDHPIKVLGVHTVPVRLHPDVHAEITVTVVPE